MSDDDDDDDDDSSVVILGVINDLVLLQIIRVGIVENATTTMFLGCHRKDDDEDDDDMVRIATMVISDSIIADVDDDERITITATTE